MVGGILLILVIGCVCLLQITSPSAPEVTLRQSLSAYKYACMVSPDKANSGKVEANDFLADYFMKKDFVILENQEPKLDAETLLVSCFISKELGATKLIVQCVSAGTFELVGRASAYIHGTREDYDRNLTVTRLMDALFESPVVTEGQ